MTGGRSWRRSELGLAGLHRVECAGETGALVRCLTAAHTAVLVPGGEGLISLLCRALTPALCTDTTLLTK